MGGRFLDDAQPLHCPPPPPPRSADDDDIERARLIDRTSSAEDSGRDGLFGGGRLGGGGSSSADIYLQQEAVLGDMEDTVGTALRARLQRRTQRLGTAVTLAF